MTPMSASPAARQPFHVMVKPIGPLCNLDCKYCFYLEKTALFADNEKWRMSDELLEQFIRDYLASQPPGPVTFAWQGGEPTLCGLGFFQKAVRFQRQYGAGRVIENALQTNGTLIDDEWARFFHDERFLIGVSIDGPEPIHDAYRVDRGGKGTFRAVRRGIDMLQRHNVEFNTLTCINRVNEDKPDEVYRFLKGIGSQYMQFIPIVERRPDAEARALGLTHAVPPAGSAASSAALTKWSCSPSGYGSFLWGVFQKWVRKDVGKVYVQIFDVALGKWLGLPGGLCVHAETCGNAVALEHDGNLYSCDHYVYPQYRLGNIAASPIATLAESVAQQTFGNDKATLPRYCRECPVRFACNGGCPKQRFCATPDGELGLNYLCPGYRSFFTRIDPYLQTMAQLYRAQRAPADIMLMIDGRGRLVNSG
jgi:uncharacterized protein